MIIVINCGPWVVENDFQTTQSNNLQPYSSIQVFGITINPIKIVWYYHNDN